MTNSKNLCYNTQTLQNQTKGLEMTTSVVQFRVDENLKKQADELFADLGLDTGTALRMFLKQAIKIGGLPFKVLREKEKKKSKEFYDKNFYNETNVRLIKESYERLKNGGGTARELIDD